MSKIIRMTPEYIEECRKDFEASLKNAKLADGKITFTKTFTAGNKKATVFFTAEAWVKMVMLLNEFSKEVAWHGVAHRLDTPDADEYIITDIVVYPQKVTGTTVEMDTEKYATWLMENYEDERFNNIRMQGHSHVNMGTTPSGVDLNHQEEILAQLSDDDFYIFMIYNKSFKRTVKIYDLQKNVLFEDGDVDVKIHDATVGFEEFIKGAKEMVEDKVYTYRSPTTGSTVYSGQTGKPYNPLSGTAGNAPPVTPASGNKGATTEKGTNEKPKTQIGAGWRGAAAANACDQKSLWDEDDPDNPYAAWGIY